MIRSSSRRCTKAWRRLRGGPKGTSDDPIAVRGEVESLLGEALDQSEQGNRELRDLAHGILPRALTRGDLRAGVDAFVARLDLPVAIDVPAERLPAELRDQVAEAPGIAPNPTRLTMCGPS
jgi:hypothetical protein